MLSSKVLAALGIAIGIPTLGVALGACSSDSSSVSPSPSTLDASIEAGTPPPGPPATADCTDGGLRVAFNPMYSAYDGKHTFQVPAVVLGSDKNVTWYADESMVGMQAASERPNEVLITMLKAGSVAINVKDPDGKCGSSILTIDPATEADWEIGNARYNNGQSLHLSGGSADGGSPLEEGSGGPACTSCHGETATNGPYTNVSHTPEQTGGFSDDELLHIIEDGKFPDGRYFDTSIVQYPIWMNFHRWADIQPDQERGIIAYLRSLTPSSQRGSVNFGAFLPDASAFPDTGAPPGTDASPADAAPADAGDPDAADGG